MSFGPFAGPVLVTGASGYVASWVVHELLSRGATVHGTVRDPSNEAKVRHLLELAESLPGTLKLFAADLLEDGSFDDAIAGCCVVFHTASPFIVSGGDPETTLVKPALEGTQNVLGSVNRTETVTRVVLTSSVVALYGDAQESGPRTLTEDEWNLTSTAAHKPYPYSKTLAEREAWTLADAQRRWRLVVMNPAFVMGPSLSKRKDGTSVDFLLNNLNGKFSSGTLPMVSGFVDVRDVAFAHVEGAVRPDAAGRHILAAESRSMYAYGQLIDELFPGKYAVPAREFPKWVAYLAGPFVGFSWAEVHRNMGYALTFDNTKSREALGLEYRSLKDTVRDHVEQLERDGLVG